MTEIENILLTHDEEWEIHNMGGNQNKQQCMKLLNALTENCENDEQLAYRVGLLKFVLSEKEFSWLR